jgi:hypothetical protein
MFPVTVAFLTVASSGAFADSVTVKNGDRVTGKILKKDKDTLTIKSDMFGEVTVKWENMTSVTSDTPLHVVLPDGQTVVGKVETRGENVEVAAQPASKEVPIVGVQAIRDDEAQRQYERYLKPKLTDLWAGYADFGAALARGNADTTTIATGFSATRATRNDKITLRFAQLYSTALVNRVSNTTANAIRGGWSYDRNIRPRLFLNFFNDYEYDAFQNLDLRFVLGGGIGYSVIKNERSQLDLLAGIAYNHEKFSSLLPGLASLTRNSAEAYWGDDFSYKVNSKTALKQSFRMFNNLSDLGQYRINFDLGLVTNIYKWLSWQVTVSDRYLSNPLPLRKTNDLIMSTGVRATFAR